MKIFGRKTRPAFDRPSPAPGPVVSVPDTLSDDLDQGATRLKYLGDGLLDILDAMPFYVLLIDKEHRILLANKATRDTLGVDAHELVGQYCPRAVHGLEHGSYPGCPLEKAVSSQQAVEMEYFDEKHERWLKIAVYPTKARSLDGNGVYLHMIQDITEQKTAARDEADIPTASSREPSKASV